MVHTAHAPPGAPHVLVEVSRLAHVGAAGLVLASQHVPLQGWLAEQLAVHWLVAVSQAMPVGQSVVAEQPHRSPAPPSPTPRHTAPGALPLPHTAHTAPGVPHVTPTASDAAHTGDAGLRSSQHVPLQGVFDPHAEPHVCDTRLHAVPEGQSLGPLHPQPLSTQVWPAALFEQSTHALPAAPHDVACVSVAQKPVAPPSGKSQHEPLHATDAEHVVAHWSPLHAPPAQLLLDVQPHLPPPVVATHTSPTLLPAQPAQAPPEAPQASDPVPATHVPAPPSSSAQQPVLQSWVALHAVVHVWVVVSHAWFAGQSVGPLQPHAPAGPAPEMTHAEPAALPTQVVHTAAPEALHAVCDSVATQVPFVEALQHVPLHGWLDEHAVVHTWVPRSHAWPTAHPLEAEQPASPGPVSTPVSNGASPASARAASLASAASAGSVASVPASSCDGLSVEASTEPSASVPPSMSERSKLTRSSHPVVAKPATAKTPTSSSARFRSVIAFLQVGAARRSRAA